MTAVVRCVVALNSIVEMEMPCIAAALDARELRELRLMAGRRFA
jgi:hypothetical protein